MSAITLTQARATLLNFKKDLSDVSQDVFIEWGNFANRQFYDFIVGIDPERFITTSNYTVSSAPQTSALPATFYHIQPLGTGFYRIDSNGDDTEDSLTRTGHGSRLQGYYISSTNVIFTGIDDGTQYKLRYIPILTTLTALTDSIVLDEIYMEALINDLDRLYSMWDEEAGMESLADFRFVRTLEALGNTVRREPDAFSIPDSMVNF